MGDQFTGVTEWVDVRGKKKIPGSEHLEVARLSCVYGGSFGSEDASMVSGIMTEWCSLHGVWANVTGVSGTVMLIHHCIQLFRICYL